MPRSATTSDVPTSPSPSLMEALAAELVRYAPFSQMESASVEAFVARSRQAYFAPGERILAPADGPSTSVHFIRRGSVTERWGEGRGSDRTRGGRPFSARPRARATGGIDLHRQRGLLLPVACRRGGQAAGHAESAVRELPPAARRARPRVCRDSAGRRRTRRAPSPSRRWNGRSARCNASVWWPWPPRLRCRRHCAMMIDRRAGSVLVLDHEGRAEGILTRHDVLDRVTLPGVAADDAGALRHVDARADDERRRHGATTPSSRWRATASAICR